MDDTAIVLKSLAITLILICLSSPAFADDSGNANQLFVEAVQFVQSVDEIASAEERLALMEEALANLHKIIENYPSTDMAVKLISGQKVGIVSMEGIAKAVMEARWWACSASSGSECAITEALKNIDEVKFRPNRAVALSFIASAQALTSNISGAKESVTQALSDAETTIDAGDRAGRLVMIVPAQIAVGDIIGAKMSISQALANPQYNPTAISEVAHFALARAAVGDFNGAGELMNQALASLVTGEEVISHDTIGIAFIASAQAALGDI